MAKWAEVSLRLLVVILNLINRTIQLKDRDCRDGLENDYKRLTCCL